MVDQCKKYLIYIKLCSITTHIVVFVPRGEAFCGAEGGLRVGGVEDGGRLADVGVRVVALDIGPLASLVRRANSVHQGATLR